VSQRGLTGTLPCDDAVKCPYQVTSCGLIDSHSPHDWKAQTSMLGAGVTWRHCPGHLIAVPSGWSGEED